MIPLRKTFISSDTSVAAASTETDNGDFTSYHVDLAHIKYCSITLYIKGANVSSSGYVKFTFAGYDSDREAWDTDPYVSANVMRVSLNGTTAVQKSFAISPDLEKIKILSIENEDTTYAVTANASIYVK